MRDCLISKRALYAQVAEYEEQARNRYFDTPPESDYRQVCMAALTEITSVKHMIYDAPAVDAVPVVRCKDCKWWRDSMCTNKNGTYRYVPNGEWFCGSGERKENATD